MDKYEKTKLRPSCLGIVGAVVLFALLSSSGPYAPSFGVQYQPQQQQATIVVAGSNENMTTATSSTANASTIRVANETTTTSNVPNATLAEFVSNIEQVRGHLGAALVNIESGNNTLAQAHVHHPIEEVYSSIEDQLANQNSTLNQTLSVALQNLSSSVTTATLQEFESQIDYVNMLLNNSVQAVVPSSEFSNNTAFDASVVARLLDVAGHEYEEAVANGTIKAIVEYQDAQAFISRAENMFNSSASRIDQAMAQEVQEVNGLFSILNGTVMNIANLEVVETPINGIIHELAEITGLAESQLVGEETAAAEQDPIAIINNIKSLLNQLIATYRSQDYAGAESIAIEAYLENYENIEAPLAEHDQQLMEQTEVMLREELRKMIMDRVPVEQIEQQVTMINANLDRAAELLQ